MRLVDIVLSFLGLVILSPLLAGIATLVACTSNGGAIYRARRVGREGSLFDVYKFRTMVAGADRAGLGVTGSRDPRVTAVGRFLRRCKLDELPQLLNVLKGEMSFVGPRPEDPRYVAHYTREQRRLLALRPGITSVASLRFRSEEELLVGGDNESVYLQKILPAKLHMELEYLNVRSTVSDLRIMFRTLLVVLGR